MDNTAEKSKAPRAAWVCLVIAWVLFLVPIPGAGLFVGWPLNLVAFILAIVALSKLGARAGLPPLLASLIVSPVVYLIGIGILAGAINESAKTAATDAQTAPPAAPVVAVTEVTARALHAAYAANEVAADAGYKGKPLRVTGSVASIDSDMTDSPVVALDAGGFAVVHAGGLDGAAAGQLRKGQKVTLACEGAGEVIGMPQLEACSLE